MRAHLRTIAACATAALVLAISAAPVIAVKPVGRCPNGIQIGPLDLDAAIEYKRQFGFPDEGFAFFEGLFASFDKNGNGLVCLKDLPDTPGIPPFVTQLADDVSRAS
jgi:hypothetical protein